MGGAACGGTGLHYRGLETGVAVQAHEVQVVENLPPGFQELGSLRAACRPVAPGERWESVPMSDVHCTFGLLTAALEARAASIGGTRLIASECKDIGQASDGSGPAKRRCEARVAAPLAPDATASPRVPLGQDPASSDLQGELLYTSALDAWRVELSYVPRVALARSEPVPARNVLVLARATPGQVPVGVLSARCEGGCYRSSLRSGLLFAAARLGGTSLVGTRCSADAERQLCQAELALAPVLISGRRLPPAGRK